MQTQWEKFQPYPFQTPYPPEAVAEREALHEAFFSNFQAKDIQFRLLKTPDDDGVYHGIFYVNEIPYLDSKMQGDQIVSSRLMRASKHVFFPNEWLMERKNCRADDAFLAWLEPFGVSADAVRSVFPEATDGFGVYEKPFSVESLRQNLFSLLRTFHDKQVFKATYSSVLRETEFVVESCCRAQSLEEAKAMVKFIKETMQEKFAGKDYFIRVSGKTFRLSVLMRNCTENGEDCIAISNPGSHNEYCDPITVCFYRAGNVRVCTNGVPYLYASRSSFEEFGMLADNRIIPLTYLLESFASSDWLYCHCWPKGLCVLTEGCANCLNPKKTVQRALNHLPWLNERPSYEKGGVTELAAFKLLFSESEAR